MFPTPAAGAAAPARAEKNETVYRPLARGGGKQLKKHVLWEVIFLASLGLIVEWSWEETFDEAIVDFPKDGVLL